MSDGRPLLQGLLDLVGAVPVHQPAPIKLTRAQFDQLRAAGPTRVDADPVTRYSAVPIVVVDSTMESTPYLEGWIKCPSCGKPAVGHDELPCDLTLVFGPFGDVAVSKALYSFEPTFGRDREATARAIER